MAVMDLAAAKKIISEKGLKMPWEKGHDVQLNERSPNAQADAEKINERESNLLHEATASLNSKMTTRKAKAEGDDAK